MNKLYCRTYQFILSIVQPLLPWPMPQVIQGADALNTVPSHLKQDNIKKVLIITTAGFIRRGSLEHFFNELNKEGILYAVYSGVLPDPTIDIIEEAVELYSRENCESIIAIGGGSVMDCSKVTAARIAKPTQSIMQMAGLLKIRKKLPPVYAVPTTAGTGSEVTICAVITNGNTHYKYPISDPCLIPKYAILDSSLTCALPAVLTADTGMDALTHAVEAYINKFSSKNSKKYAKDATKIIFANIKTVFRNGKDLSAREQMLKGSYYAGAAFTKAYVGYVHAIAHSVGGIYGISHGHANAIILPVVLEAYGAAVYPALAQLADVVSITGRNSEEKAQNFIQAIRDLNNCFGIPDKLGVIQEKDISEIIKRALKEANPTYPVPIIWDYEKMYSVIKKL